LAIFLALGWTLGVVVVVAGSAGAQAKPQAPAGDKPKG